jgi:hypothetical protein
MADKLNTTQIVVVTVSVAAVAVGLAYYVNKQSDEAVPVPPKPTARRATPTPKTPQRQTRSVAPATAVHQAHPAQPPTTYQPYPMPQPQQQYGYQDGASDVFQQLGQQLGQIPGQMLDTWQQQQQQHPYHPAMYSHQTQPAVHPHTATQTPVTPAVHIDPHEPAAGTVYGPTYWHDAVKNLGLMKPADRIITVAEAQHYLNTIGGYPHLAEDNAMGPQTHAAIEAFQMSHHLPKTGLLDKETSSALLYAAFVSATPQMINPGF